MSLGIVEDDVKVDLKADPSFLSRGRPADDEVAVDPAFLPALSAFN